METDGKTALPIAYSESPLLALQTLVTEKLYPTGCGPIDKGVLGGREGTQAISVP